MGLNLALVLAVVLLAISYASVSRNVTTGTCEEDQS